MSNLELAIKSALNKQYPDRNDMGSEVEKLFLHQIQISSIPIPEREVYLIQGRRFRYDFVWEKEKIAVEIQGGTYWGKKCHHCGNRPGGRHNRGPGYDSDCVKQAEVQLLGYRIFSFSTTLVKNGYAIDVMKKLFKSNVQLI